MCLTNLSPTHWGQGITQYFRRFVLLTNLHNVCFDMLPETKSLQSVMLLLCYTFVVASTLLILHFYCKDYIEDLLR